MARAKQVKQLRKQVTHLIVRMPDGPIKSIFLEPDHEDYRKVFSYGALCKPEATCEELISVTDEPLVVDCEECCSHEQFAKVCADRGLSLDDDENGS